MCKEEIEAFLKQLPSFPLGTHKDCEKCMRIASLLAEIETWSFSDMKQESNDYPVIFCRINQKVKLSLGAWGSVVVKALRY